MQGQKGIRLHSIPAFPYVVMNPNNRHGKMDRTEGRSEIKKV